jgi:hypothetical protein
MILRTKKGYPHVGGNADGTTLPSDIGMDRGLAHKAANFVHRRSLSQPDAQDANRMQLVGLVPTDHRSQLPVGAHVLAHRPPAPIDGFVTSSCHSSGLGHSYALAILAGGSRRLGEQVTVWNLGFPVAAEVIRAPIADADLPLPEQTARLQVRTVETTQVLSLRHLPGGSADTILDVRAAIGLPALPAAGRCVGNDPLPLWRSPSECLLASCTSEVSQTVCGSLIRLPGALAWGFDITAGGQLWELRGPDVDALLRVVDAGALPAGVGQGTRLRLADIAVIAWRQHADGIRYWPNAATMATSRPGSRMPHRPLSAAMQRHSDARSPWPCGPWRRETAQGRSAR